MVQETGTNADKTTQSSGAGLEEGREEQRFAKSAESIPIVPRDLTASYDSCKNPET